MNNKVRLLSARNFAVILPLQNSHRTHISKACFNMHTLNLTICDDSTRHKTYKGSISKPWATSWTLQMPEQRGEKWRVTGKNCWSCSAFLSVSQSSANCSLQCHGQGQQLHFISAACVKSTVLKYKFSKNIAKNHSNKLVKTPAAWGQHIECAPFQCQTAFERANSLSVILLVIFR